ncbi:MAG: tryptophan-rich sensory protein [Alphaproteobacteria bacterium]|nr:tryptophan-rich sensory protein [Alphaproteobacteria bacterium]
MALARRDGAALVGALGLCLGVGYVGGTFSAASVDTWYQTLDKPALNPPDAVFPVVWTALYVAMAVAAWRVWRKAGAGRAFAWFVLQLALNLGWSWLFFGMRRIDLAMAEVLVLLAAIAMTWLAFRRVDRWAGYLFLPYLAWVGFATYLNAGLLMLID